MYIKIINETPTLYSYSQLLMDNPQVSFPRNLSNDTLATYGLLPVNFDSRPTFDEKTQYVKESAPYQDANGAWKVSYTVEQKPLSHVEEIIREERNRLLSETDWVVTKYMERKEDIPQEWLDYRQELRNITQQNGYPWDIIWPTNPMTNSSQQLSNYVTGASSTTTKNI